MKQFALASPIHPSPQTHRLSPLLGWILPRHRPWRGSLKKTFRVGRPEAAFSEYKAQCEKLARRRLLLSLLRYTA